MILRAAAFGVAVAGLWLLWPTPLLHPVKLFVVLTHELSHALAALLTGGEVRGLAVTLDQGGWCDCPGGNAFLTLSAGYLGSLGWGAGLGWLAGTGARGTLAGLVGVGGGLAAAALAPGATLVASLLAAASGAALLAAGLLLPPGGRRLVLASLGSVTALHAVLDLRSDVLARPGAPSDAAMLAELTGVPTLLWGAAWTAVSLWVAWRLARRLWRTA